MRRYYVLLYIGTKKPRFWAENFIWVNIMTKITIFGLSFFIRCDIFLMLVID